MKNTLIAIFSYICYIAASDIPKTFPISQSKTNWEEITALHQEYKEASKTKRDKFSCVLNLLKNALAEELLNAQLLTEKKELSNTNNIDEPNIIAENQQILQEPEGQIERPSIIIDNRTENVTNKASVETLSGHNDFQNSINNQDNFEIPNMIPIFKPRVQTTPRKESNQNLADFNSNHVIPIVSPSSKRVLKSEVVVFTPEKIVQNNLSPISGTPIFKIPCQRAADVLDMNIAVPKEAILCRNINVNSKINLIPNNLKTNIPQANIVKQIQTPPTAKCADEDDTIAMLFKPKNISIKEVYGNLLKEITLTVLVPYHMTKLGRK